MLGFDQSSDDARSDGVEMRNYGVITSVRPISKFLCRFDIDILPQQNADNRPISIFLRSRADIISKSH